MKDKEGSIGVIKRFTTEAVGYHNWKISARVLRSVLDVLIARCPVLLVHLRKNYFWQIRVLEQFRR